MIVSIQSYSPAANLSVTATSMTAVNAANLFADFSLRYTTDVIVDMSCVVQSIAGGTLFFGLRDSAGVVVGSKQSMYVTAGTDTIRVFYRQTIFNLTPGANYRWYWAAMVATGGEQFDILGTTAAVDENQMVMLVQAEDS